MGAWENSSTFAGFTPSQLVSGVFASEDLLIRDRAQVLSAIGAGSFSIGFDVVISGDASATGDGFLSDRASVLGDATLSGGLSGDRDGVSGDIREGLSVVFPELPVRAGSSSGADLEVPHDSLQVLAPGEYGDVLVHSRATLQLGGAGLYRFTSLHFEPDAFLRIGGDFDVALAVDGDLVLGDRFEMAVNNQSSLDSGHLFLYSAGTFVEYGHDINLVGNLEAPFAHVEVRDRSFVRGALLGQSMTIGHDTVVGPRAAFGEAGPGSGCDSQAYEAEAMFHSTGGSFGPDAWNIWSNGFISTEHDFAAGPAVITVSALGQAAASVLPHMVVMVDGVAIGDAHVTADGFNDYDFSFNASGGVEQIQVAFDNDFFAPPADRNLIVGTVSVNCGGP
jgi:hypothetical protein